MGFEFRQINGHWTLLYYIETVTLEQSSNFTELHLPHTQTQIKSSKY